jgi:hypothetical protein
VISHDLEDPFPMTDAALAGNDRLQAIERERTERLAAILRRCLYQQATTIDVLELSLELGVAPDGKTT